MAAQATGSDMPPKRREDTRQCRICLAGPEEEPDLGRLIKPCHCKGSIRYVHVKCIQEWRRTGSAVNRNSFYACGQCGFKYNLARTKILGVSTSPWVLGPTTVFLFLIIVFAASGVVSFFAPNLLDPTIPAPRSAPVLDYSGSTWWYSPFGIASEVVRETLHAFAEVSTPQEVLDAQRSEDAMYVEDTSTWFRFRAEDTSTWGRFKTKIPYYTKEKKRPRRGSHRRDPRTPLEDNQKITIWMRLTRKFMLGLSLVGILSFLNILFTIGLFGPLHLARARWVRGGRRQAGIRDAGTVIIVVFVTIGVARALYGVWKMTNRLAHWVLLRAENAILEVQDDDNDEEEEEVEAKDGPRNVLTDAPRPSDTETVPQSETSTTTRPDTLRINNLRQRHPQEDDFGDELPDTPGSWREEWHA